MSDRIKLAALLFVAFVALGTLGIVIGNFVANDWRLAGNPLDLSFLFGDEEPEFDADERTVAHSLVFGDSVRTVRIQTSALRIRIGESATSQLHLRLTLNGDATDSTLYRWSARTTADELAVAAGPTGAIGNATGVLELSIPPSLRITIDSHSGDVSLVNVAVSSDIVARNGSIDVTGVRGSIRATADGDIALDGCRLDSAVLKAGGAVTVTLTEGAIRARGGEVFASRHFGSLDATARGAIRADILSIVAPVRLVADEGDVHLRVLDGARFAYDVEAPLGSIIANVPFDTLTPQNATEHTVRATMNGGGVPAVIRAARGSVEILLFEAGESLERQSYAE